MAVIDKKYPHTIVTLLDIQKYCPLCNTIHSANEIHAKTIFDKFSEMTLDQKLEEIYKCLKSIEFGQHYK